MGLGSGQVAICGRMCPRMSCRQHSSTQMPWVRALRGSIDQARSSLPSKAPGLPVKPRSHAQAPGPPASVNQALVAAHARQQPVWLPRMQPDLLRVALGASGGGQRLVGNPVVHGHKVKAALPLRAGREWATQVA